MTKMMSGRWLLLLSRRRRLHPKFGTSEIVFSKLRREFFVPAE